MVHIMLYNEKAVTGLPTYLLVAIIVSVSVIAVFSIGIFNIWKESEFHKAEFETDRIVAEAENMFEYADEGSLISLTAVFPSSMKFVVFGGLPENGNLEPTNFFLNQDTSNNYYFVMDDGRLYTGHTHARFSGESTDNIAFFSKGEFDIKLKLIKEVDGKTYVKIY